MRNGFKVFDADTHLQPSVETLTPYMDAATQARQPELAKFMREVKTGRAGQVLEAPFTHWYRFESRGGWGSGKPRHLGEAGPREKEERHFQNFQGRIYPSRYSEDGDIETRIAEMDQEGVDVELMVHGAFTGHEDLSVDAAMIGAVHRSWTTSAGATRTASPPSSPRAPVTWRTPSARSRPGEARAGRAASCWSCPRLSHRPPGPPPRLGGCRRRRADRGAPQQLRRLPRLPRLWDNPFIGRTASHPWGAMRMTAAFLGAGLLDKYPNLNLAILESGFGWLPFWMKRMEDQVHYMATSPKTSSTRWRST